MIPSSLPSLIPPVDLSWADEQHASNLGHMRFLAHILRMEWSWTRQTSVHTELLVTDVVEPDWEIVNYYSRTSAGQPSYESLVAMNGASVVFLTKSRYDQEFTIQVAAADDDTALRALFAIRDKLPPIIRRDDGTISINFWVNGPHGPVNRPRRIKSVGWDEISRNYGGDATPSIEEVTHLLPPIEGGRLLLWHGEPGTGKTTAVRALAQTWQPWCDVNYIVDPEQFFGSADYMLGVLLDSNDSSYFEGKGPLVLQGSDRWRLLIVEDADEFLRSDAKLRSGQSLSRLLNITDGLIGQGLNVLVLITTNEALGDIHPAVSREGRCVANIEFPRLSRTESLDWLGENPGVAVSSEECTVARLYDLRRQQRQIALRRTPASAGQYL